MVTMHRMYRIDAPRRKTHGKKGVAIDRDQSLNLALIRFVRSGKEYWYSVNSLVAI